ncbi:MAG TPA: hypothetical protein VIJ39_05090 [Solirubrobacteraceae bacterium]
MASYFVEPLVNKRIQILGIMVGILTTICLFAAPRADACTAYFIEGQNYHCYEVVEWAKSYGGPSQIEWGYAAIKSTQMNPPHEIPDRYQNELWVFPGNEGGGPWIEVGDTIGYTAIGWRTTPTYFWAVQPPGYTFQEYDMPNGPAVGELFWAYARAAGNGGWCAIINSTQLGCQNAYSTYAGGEESGLEAGSNTPPDTLVNSGSTAMFYQELNGVNYPSEPARAATPTPFPPKVAWCYIYPNPYKNEIAFGTGYAPCPSGEKETKNEAPGAFVSGPLSTSLSGETPLTESSKSPEPAEGFVKPTGPKLTTDQIKSMVHKVSSEDNENNQEPSSSTVYAMNLSEAQRAMESGMTPSASTSTGMRNWLESEVYLIVLKGHFTLGNAPIPKSSKEPTGSTLVLAIDAHTGVVDGEGVGNTVPAEGASYSAKQVLAW